jgi:hypothetical protein
MNGQIRWSQTRPHHASAEERCWKMFDREWRGILCDRTRMLWRVVIPSRVSLSHHNRACFTSRFCSKSNDGPIVERRNRRGGQLAWVGPSRHEALHATIWWLCVHTVGISDYGEPFAVSLVGTKRVVLRYAPPPPPSLLIMVLSSSTLFNRFFLFLSSLQMVNTVGGYQRFGKACCLQNFHNNLPNCTVLQYRRPQSKIFTAFETSKSHAFASVLPLFSQLAPTCTT